MKEGQIGLGGGIDRDDAIDQYPLPRIGRKNRRNFGNPFRLPNAFVVRKEERFIFDDRAADRPSKLITLEWRNLPHVKIVPRVKNVVAEKLVSASVKPVRP